MRIINLTRSLDPSNGGTVSACKAYHRTLISLGFSSELIDIDYLSPRIVKNNYGFSFTSFFKIIKHIKNADFIFVHGLWQFHGVIALFCRLFFGTPLVIFPHGMAAKYFDKFKAKRLKKKLYWMLVESFLVKFSCAIVFIGSGESESASKYFKTLSLSKEFIIPIPFDLSSKKIDFGVNGCLRLLFIGRNHPIKRLKPFLLLLNNICKDYNLNDITINVIGDYPSDFFSDIDDVFFNINFLGSLYDEDKNRQIIDSHCIVVPSEYESFGLVVLEAIYNNKYVLVSNGVGVLSDLPNCHNVIGFDMDDYENLAFKIKKLYLNPRIILSEGQNDVFFSYFSTENVSLKLKALINDKKKLSNSQ